MIIKQEVEATPALVLEQLCKHRDRLANSKFPWSRDSKLIIKPAYLEAVGGIPGMPSLVLSSQQGTPLGMVAIYKADGDITMAYVTEDQVESIYQA
jgi:hypothetical protein